MHVLWCALQLQVVFPRERQETVWIGERVRRFFSQCARIVGGWKMNDGNIHGEIFAGFGDEAFEDVGVVVA